MDGRSRMTRRFAYTIVGLAAGFSGLAVLASILTPVALIAAEVVTVAIASIALIVVIRRAPRPVLLEVGRAAAAGIFAGAVATLGPIGPL